MRHNLRTFWRLSLLRTRFPLDNRLQAMLSEKQMKLVASQVNEDLNIPVFSESSEGAMIMELVQRIAPQIEPSLKVFLPLVYVECIRYAVPLWRRAPTSAPLTSAPDAGQHLSQKWLRKCRIALSEGMSPQDRRRAITKKLQAELEEPLAKELNSRGVSVCSLHVHSTTGSIERSDHFETRPQGNRIPWLRLKYWCAVCSGLLVCSGGPRGQGPHRRVCKDH